ncbi:MAG: hypothetical protein QM767_17985 [Anaeromyxobacter sp.]
MNEWTAVTCPDATIDVLRKQFADQAERLLAAVGKATPHVIAGLASRLLETSQQLFEREERRLAEGKASSLVRHAHEHGRFLADLAELAELAQSGDAAGLETLRPQRWLKSWIAAHARTDKDLAALTPAA